MKNTLTAIRERLSHDLGKKVVLTAYEPRNVVIEHTGTLSQTYPSVFIIDLDTYPRSPDRISYNYSDILTGDIELKFMHANDTAFG